MTDDPTGADRFKVQTTAESHFSWLRTRMSAERTLMSWIRTATALIGFGFTIVQFLDRLQDMSNVEPALRPLAPRYLGLTLILTGIISLVIAVWQYHWLIGYLRDGPFAAVAGVAKAPRHTPTVAVAIILIIIGIFAFGAVFLRLK